MSGHAWPADSVERRPVASLVPYIRNARTHSDEQVAQLAGSIREFGWTMPILLDEAGTIIAGHGRVLAAQRLGLEDVPCMTARGWTDAQVRAYRIADNRLALNAGWDDSLLRLELGDLRAASFDLGLIGFSDAEIAGLLADGSERPARITPPHHAEHDIRVIIGDCREVLPTLPADSVHCVVTSPPYYGLRDYGTAQWEGGDPNCQHVFARDDNRLMLGSDGKLGKNCTSWTHRDATPPKLCKCGARRIDSQIGLEATPEEWLATMVAVFREVRHVLRDDGTCWVNVGDSYAQSGGHQQTEEELAAQKAKGWYGDARGRYPSRATSSGRAANTAVGGIKPKDLMLMPARLALALQADGWWLRSDIIWSKPNPMPESVTDRPTNAHEHIFLLTKSPRYFYDADAVREEPTGRTDPMTSFGRNNPNRSDGGNSYQLDGTAGRNLRNVWTIATAPFPEAHFATFPPELAERCIRAGTSEAGCCAQCGAPWVRETQATGGILGKTWGNHADDLTQGNATAGLAINRRTDEPYQRTTTGWSPGCKCDVATPRPCMVLDPFAGSGTTLLVADQLQCDAIGIELNPDYIDLAKRRAGAQEQAAAE